MPYRFDNPAEFRYEPGALFLGLDAAGNEIGIKTEVHALTVGGSGAGKGAALLVQNARRWPHNLLLIDPKGENAVLSWEARERLGQRVVILDPFEQIPRGDIPDRLRASVNPLAEIDADSPRARASLVALGSGLVVAHDPRHMEWIEGARKMLAGLCAYVVANAPPETRTFGMVRKILMQSDHFTDDDGEAAGLYADAQRMAADDRLGGLIRNAGKQILTALESEKGIERDFLGNVRRATEWLDDEAIAATLNASTFRMSEIKTGAVSVYLVLPPDYVRDYAAFLRLFVKTALSAMGAPIKNGRECLFLLDEFYSLQKLDELTEAAGRMRSYGVHLWPFLQGLGQLYELYGKEGAQTFMTNAAAHVFLGCDQDPYTLRNISERIGLMTVEDIGVEPPRAGYASAQPAKDGILSSAADTSALNQTAAAAVAASNANARAKYDHALKKLGRPRLTPDEVAALIGKPDEKSVARSMIVFMPRGKVLNIRPAPYFKENAPAAPGELMETKAPDSSASIATRTAPTGPGIFDHIDNVLYHWRRQLAAVALRVKNYYRPNWKAGEWEALHRDGNSVTLGEPDGQFEVRNFRLFLEACKRGDYFTAPVGDARFSVEREKSAIWEMSLNDPARTDSIPLKLLNEWKQHRIFALFYARLMTDVDTYFAGRHPSARKLWEAEHQDLIDYAARAVAFSERTTAMIENYKQKAAARIAAAELDDESDDLRTIH